MKSSQVVNNKTIKRRNQQTSSPTIFIMTVKNFIKIFALIKSDLKQKTEEF